MHLDHETSRSTQTTNDYHQVPPTEKQLAYARLIAARTDIVVPSDVQQHRYELSRWIDAHKDAKPANRFSNYPSSKQVGFAERIARIKRRDVPHECFKDRTMMSKWIDANV
jgi:hypothetical protein